MTAEVSAAPETDLLFGCLRARPDASALRAIAQGPVDWPAFLALVENANLTALCCRRLEQACPEAVPPDVLGALRRRLKDSSERNLFLSAELLRILERFSGAGLRALAFKGPVLAWWLYGHPGLRSFHDLDLLVDSRDLNRAIELFAALGYSPKVGRARQPKLLLSEGQLSLYRANPPAVVDLHWSLAPYAMKLALDAKHLLPRAAAVPVAGRPVLTFGAEDQILLCAFHGSKHGWTNLSWLADLSALMETQAPDWPRLLAEARRKKLSRALFVALRLAHALLGTPIPPEIRKPLERDRAAARLGEEARRFLLNFPLPRSVFPRELHYEFQLTESWSDKASYLWRKATEPSAEDWELSKAARPFRLIRKYALKLASWGGQSWLQPAYGRPDRDARS